MPAWKGDNQWDFEQWMVRTAHQLSASADTEIQNWKQIKNQHTQVQNQHRLSQFSVHGFQVEKAPILNWQVAKGSRYPWERAMPESKPPSIFLYVCEHVCEHVCLGECACMCRSTLIWGIFYYPVPYFRREGSSLAWGMPIRLDLPASKPQVASCFRLPALGLFTADFGFLYKC